MVRIHPDPPPSIQRGAIAQLGERLLCKQEVTGSIPVGSTSNASEETATNRARAIGWCFFEVRFTEASIGCSLTIWDRR